MNDMKNPGQPERALTPSPRGSARKPYLKPAFRHEQVFETMALACGKMSGTQPSCFRNRRSS
jgi:hypothetical protein